MTTFVEMYHPLIPSTNPSTGTPARVAVQAVDERAAQGWLLVDPDAVLPDPVTPYYTKEALLSQVQGGASPIGTALRAAFALSVASTASANATLAVNKHTPVDASGGARTMTLPTGQAEGTRIIVEKVDASTNPVTISGSFRGSAGTQVLVGQFEAMSFLADSAGSWHPGPSHKTKTWLDGTYARKWAARRRDPKVFNALPAVHPAPPTLTYIAPGASPITNPLVLPYNTDLVTSIGAVITDNSSQNFRDNAIQAASPWAIEFDHHGNDLAYVFRAAQSNTNWRIWIFVDDQPITVAPDPIASLGTSSGGSYYRVRLQFASVAERRIRIHQHLIQFNSLELPQTATVSPTAKPPWSIGVLGDSFVGGGGGVQTLEAFPQTLGQLIGAEVYNAGVGGTGYMASATPFTNATRLAALASAKPDVVLIVGSCNDDPFTYTQIKAAAESTYSQLATLLPGVPVIVIGPEPTDVTTTLGAARTAARDAVRDAAALHSNVIAFVDPLGNAASGVTMTTWTSGTVYNAGDIVQFAGGVYVCLTAHTASGSRPMGGFNSTRNWRLASWYTGTGKVGTTAANGNRDLLLNADGTHPTLGDGNGFWARRSAQVVLSALATIS